MNNCHKSHNRARLVYYECTLYELMQLACSSESGDQIPYTWKIRQIGFNQQQQKYWRILIWWTAELDQAQDAQEPKDYIHPPICFALHDCFQYRMMQYLAVGWSIHQTTGYTVLTLWKLPMKI